MKRSFYEVNSWTYASIQPANGGVVEVSTPAALKGLQTLWTGGESRALLTLRDRVNTGERRSERKIFSKSNDTSTCEEEEIVKENYYCCTVIHIIIINLIIVIINNKNIIIIEYILFYSIIITQQWYIVLY